MNACKSHLYCISLNTCVRKLLILKTTKKFDFIKKLTKINLRKLSQAELAEREQSILKGGLCGCASVCWGDACACNESAGGGFASSSNNTAASGTGDDSKSTNSVWEGNSNSK